MKFKTEIGLLLTAIALFATSAFLYSYTPTASTEAFTTTSASTLPDYPYQSYAFSFVGFGSLLMTAASFSFLKRSKATTAPHVTIRAKKISEELR
jgi:hypothetical protein